MRVTTAAETPHIAEAAFSIPYREDGGGAFMAAHRTAKLVSRTRPSRLWPEHTVVVMSDDGDALARAVSIPYATKVASRELFPDGGWEQVVDADRLAEDRSPSARKPMADRALVGIPAGRGLTGGVTRASS